MNVILSVWDKTGLVEFAERLVRLDATLYATGKTAATLEGAGLPVRGIGDLTGLPEMLGGRVKTLHPGVLAGILADRDIAEHRAQLAEHGFRPIDLVVVNLYPFRATIEAPETTEAEAIEQIDVGGVTLLRAAAKNFRHTLPVVDPRDYDHVADRLAAGQADAAWRRGLAAKAFQHVASYDTQIAGYLRGPDPLFPAEMTIALAKVQDLRYGENPHQRAALYAQTPFPRGAAGIGLRQIHGKTLSYTNLLDVDAAFACVSDFAAVAAVVVKHGNPCGLACATDLAEAYRAAYAGDPLSAFGGAVGLNREVDATTAQLIADTFFEDVVAPGYSDAALAVLRRKRDLRIMVADPPVVAPERASINPTYQLEFRRVNGGFLVQTRDALAEDDLSLKTVTEREPTLEELTDLLFAWRAVKHVKSNAIVLAKRLSLVGVGAGQMSRVDAVDLAVRKAGDRSVASVLASDAFFPMPDGPERAADAGVTAIIQPGGSIRDEEVIRVANRHHLAMLVTGRRHFRH